MGSHMTQINFKLDNELSKYLDGLKDWHKINNNNDMIRNLIAEGYQSMLREKKELGIES